MEEHKEQLPAFEDVVRRFSLFSESPSCSPQIRAGGSLGCDCDKCNEWHAFVEGRCPTRKLVQYEVFTLEHVKTLAQYLLRRAAHYGLPRVKVLEVGAGSGRLCSFLHDLVSAPIASSQGSVVELTATDNGERQLNGPNVVNQDALEALSAALPHVVLVSWMPKGVDWTAAMRATPSVLEYILVGEIDGGICGDPWLTWGYTGDEVTSSSNSSSNSEQSVSVQLSNGTAFCVSNYGPGRPAAVTQTGLETSPSCDYYEGNSLEQGHRSTVAECQPCAEESLVVKENDPKRLRLHPHSGVQSPASSEDVHGPLPEHLSPSIRGGNSRRQQFHSARSRKKTGKLAPSTVDGWVRTELKSLSSFQICRTDERWSTLQHSHTVSFRRCPSGQRST